MTSRSATPEYPQDPPLRLELERNHEAPAIARAAISGFAGDLDLDPELIDTLKLLVSEIVTNAVIHPDAPKESGISLSACMLEGLVRVAVTDQGGGFTPKPRDSGKLVGGYGLFLVDQQATEWGVERRNGTTVWFEVAQAPVALP